MEWAVAQCASKSISQTNTQQPESLPGSREEMARRGVTEERDQTFSSFS